MKKAHLASTVRQALLYVAYYSIRHSNPRLGGQAQHDEVVQPPQYGGVNFYSEALMSMSITRHLSSLFSGLDMSFISPVAFNACKCLV